MKTAFLTLENDMEVEVGFFYYPPEDPGFRGDIEIKKVTVLQAGPYLRQEWQHPESLDLIARNWIEDNWGQHLEQFFDA